MTPELQAIGQDLKELLPILPSQRIDKDMASADGIFIISIGGALNPPRNMVSKGTNMQPDGWVSRFRLMVFDHCPDPTYGLQIFVGEARDPHRIFVNTKKVDSNGWTHRLDFWAYSQDIGDCVKITVGQALEPHRSKFEIGRKISNAPEDDGWEQQFSFWVKSTSFS